MAWWITFIVVITVLMILGFGAGGIVPGKFYMDILQDYYTLLQ
jgi:hypothetical protein